MECYGVGKTTVYRKFRQMGVELRSPAKAR
jgi:hypothetical protein